MWPKFSNYMGVGVVIMGCQKSKSFVMGLSEIYLSWYTLFFQFPYYRRRNKRLKTVVSMLSCGAHERSNNPYIESIVGPCFSNNQKDIFAVWFWFWRKSWRGWGNGKRHPRAESGICVIMCWRKKKQLWNFRNHFKIFKKCKSLLFKRDFKIAEILSKNILFFLLQRPF